jgi:hypothetical protein
VGPRHPLPLQTCRMRYILKPVTNPMPQSLEAFQNWIQEKGATVPYFAGTFWLVLSPLVGPDFASALDLQPLHTQVVPMADFAGRVTFAGRSTKTSEVTFWHLPFHRQQLHLLFSLAKPWQAARFLYKMLGRARGKAHLFPIGHRLAKSCGRLNSGFPFEQTRVIRGVSYPSRPHEGGADINLKPGNAATFFAKVEDEGRVLKLARMVAPTGGETTCEYTVSRLGYISYHRGEVGALLKFILGQMSEEMTASVKPFEEARGRFVGLRFPGAAFTERVSYGTVLEALSRLPRTTVALLHANPYFHATLTNYEDGGEFDVFITGPSTIHLHGRGEASAASFLRLHNNLAEVFREAEVALEMPQQFRLRDLLEGRV